MSEDATRRQDARHDSDRGRSCIGVKIRPLQSNRPATYFWRFKLEINSWLVGNTLLSPVIIVNNPIRTNRETRVHATQAVCRSSHDFFSKIRPGLLVDTRVAPHTQHQRPQTSAYGAKQGAGCAAGSRCKTTVGIRRAVDADRQTKRTDRRSAGTTASHADPDRPDGVAHAVIRPLQFVARQRTAAGRKMDPYCGSV